MSALIPEAIGSAALAVLLERQRQVDRFGHHPQADDALPDSHLLREAHVRLLMAADLVMGRPEAATLLRARTKTIQAAALCLAQIDRLDRQIRTLTLNEEGKPA